MTNKIVLNKIFQIEKELNQGWKINEDFSLLTGIGGLPLFYLMLFDLTKDKKYLKKIQKIVENIFDKLNNSNYNISYSTGLTGLADLFDFLDDTKLVNEDLTDTLLSLDDIILNFTKNHLESYEDIDFLHGALGAANYLLKRTKNNKKIEEDVIILFERIAKIVNDDINETKLVLNSNKIDETLHKTNCGLAHGHISVIIIFSKFLTKYINHTLIKDTLRNSIDCLLKFKSRDNTNIATFPSVAVTNLTADYNVPLGWCYGDQTISIGLYRASQVLIDEKIYLEAISIARRTLIRDTLMKAFISPLNDAGFCHGSSSLAYIHKKWFQITNEKRFNDLYLKFIKEIVYNGDNKLGMVGYHKYMGNNEYKKVIGLLDGTIGIGIVLIDYLLKNENSFSWDQFFLLD